MKNKTIKSITILIAVFVISFIVNHINSINILPHKIDGFEIHYIDVGQADATAVFLPDGKTMLIDGGNDNDGDKIAKYFNKYGINRIDYLIATHPHEDHIGGLSTIVETFDIGNIYMPKVSYDSTAYTNLLETIDSKGLLIISAKKGVVVANTDEYYAEILSPVRERYNEMNYYSVVLKLTYKNTTYLFTGDAEIINENELEGDISADVLKVGHHGSDTSSSEAFLNKVNPKIAVIHVGKDNSYSHPHDVVLNRLEERKVTTLRTDINGTVIIRSNGDDITYKGEK